MMDPVTVEVVRGGLTYVSEEMGVALRRSAYSPNIKERLDFSCAVFDRDRRLLAQAEHIPVHLGSLPIALRNGLDHFGRGLREGDALILNDPYISGTHLPDVTLIAPIHRDGELLGYVANKAHHSDMGGISPGSLSIEATELQQEGLVIPPVLLVEEGEVSIPVIEMIKANVRTPALRMGDLRAQLSALHTGIKGVRELAERVGEKGYLGSLDPMIAASEARMRAVISTIPDGHGSAEDLIESPDGRKIALRVRVEVKGSDITFDYEGTDPQVRCPLNAPYGVTLAGVMYSVLSLTDPTIPMNEGCFIPLSVRVPKGSMLDPIRPAPVAGGNVETSQRNVDLILAAFDALLPGRVPAQSQGTMNNVCVGGWHEGRQWSFYETIGGGAGASFGKDGESAVQVNMTNTMNTPLEAMEAEFPIRFLRYSIRDGSGGTGKWRGGDGIERSWKLLADSATLSLMGERQVLAPKGIHGGMDGSPGEYLILKPTGDILRLPSKCTVEMVKDDVLVIRTPGGGGYGAP